jgi:hypothetical protein
MKFFFLDCALRDPSWDGLLSVGGDSPDDGAGPCTEVGNTASAGSEMNRASPFRSKFAGFRSRCAIAKACNNNKRSSTAVACKINQSASCIGCERCERGER